MIANNVILHFSSSRNVRELSELTEDVLRVMGLSVLNREVIKLRVQPQPNEYELVINLVLTEAQERAIREVFRKRKYNIFWSDFENMES